MLVEQSTEGGSLLKEDARLLEGVFEFSEKTAQEVMTPRTQMVALEADLTVEEAADEVAVARPLPLSGVHRVARRDRRRGARQGHPRPRSAPGRAQTVRDDHAPAAVRARHPRGRGRAGRHEAAQDPPGRGARRVRRHRRPGDDGGPAGGDRRPDLRRVRSAGPARRRPTAPRGSTARCRSPSSTPSTTRPSTTPTTPPSAATSSASSGGCRGRATG